MSVKKESRLGKAGLLGGFVAFVIYQFVAPLLFSPEGAGLNMMRVVFAGLAVMFGAMVGKYIAESLRSKDKAG
ncbi:MULTISPECIES: hypothetical protein [Halomonadaceae]|uniref:hypothetical protein n=1 Tax=Halomonadaceae TaxID=28256 RepID=UPI001598566F|nr:MULTISPECIES: hypothetical protein [Halomonas]QJQ96163.1 hypothetical protein HIO72_13380 [Halomonas sp. PA5]